MKKTLAILLAVFALVIAVPAYCIVMQAVQAPQAEGTVVVLGCGVRGETPSKVLRTRIDAAAAYLKEHPSASPLRAPLPQAIRECSS